MYYDYNIADREWDDYKADMMELAGEGYTLTDEEMEAMAREFDED